MPRAVGVDLAGAQRARADEAHVASQDVHELRQFVHRRGAEQLTHACDPRIVSDGLQGTTFTFGVRQSP